MSSKPKCLDCGHTTDNHPFRHLFRSGLSPEPEVKYAYIPAPELEPVKTNFCKACNKSEATHSKDHPFILDIRKCKVCGNPRNNHPFRHKFS